jgi:hypothetical protein
MTMLVSLFSAEGIVFAADRQIVGVTSEGQTSRHRHGHRPKVMRVHGLGVGRNGVVGYWGLAQVSGRPMAEWLAEQANGWLGSRTVEEFARHLQVTLPHCTTKRERSVESGFHIAGFEAREGLKVPVCWVVRNRSEHDGRSGLYLRTLSSWDDVAEHVPRGNLEDVSVAELRTFLRTHQQAQGMPYWLRNGDVCDFSKPYNAVAIAVQALVAEPRFSTPTALAGWERLAKTLVATAGALYRIYYATGDAPVEGSATTVSIPWP